MEQRVATFCTMMYHEQTAGPESVNFFPHTHTDKIHFIEIVNVQKRQFQGERFESSTFESLYAIISHLVTDGTNIAIANT